MSLKYLGKKFDFHGGGSDLIFPHHENEIAQSQACIGDDHSFAQYWLHNGFITIHNEKMSKSKNNFFTVEDILKKYPGEVVRFFILETHYRSPLDFSDDRLKEAQTSLGRLANTQEYIKELVDKADPSDDATAAELIKRAAVLKREFDAAMEDDFNTALAISQMFALSKDINIYYQEVTTGGKGFDVKNFAAVQKVWDYMASILGIFEQQAAGDDGLTEKLMALIVAIRQEARKEKNWALADKIRDDLKDAGVVLEDTPNGVRWKRA
jgi:cysteinyl-tRNA synthetase